MLHRRAPLSFPATVGWLLVCLIALALAATIASAQTPAPAQKVQASPMPAVGMGFEEARHLLSRTSFGARPEDIETFARLSRVDAVDRLLAETRTRAQYPAPPWAAIYERPFRPGMTPEQRKEANRRELVERGLELRTWWVAEMLSTPTPLTEKMTLFWHNHFVSSQQKVRTAQLMYAQNALLRQYALGNFGALLRAVSKDPAMLIYLDGAQNRKGAPNENFAREVMELFTLGEGHYTEADIKEVARAFTGWSIDPDRGEFRFRRALHDDGEKVIFGQRGRFNGDDVITLLLRQPATAEFVVGKLWREFISAQPDPAGVRQLAAIWRSNNYEIKPLLRAMLLSDAFWSPTNRASLVKSPVELVIGSLRQFGFSVEDPAPFAIALRQLGQDLFAPPNVKGWPGGESWLNTSTLLARKGFLNRLFRADEMQSAMSAGNSAPTGNADTTAQPATTVIDGAMLGDGRARRQAQLALRGGTGKLPPFGVSNQLRGQYFFSADQWFAQLPRDMDDARIASALFAGPPLQVSPPLPHTLAGLRSAALDPMYELK